MSPYFYPSFSSLLPLLLQVPMSSFPEGMPTVLVDPMAKRAE